MAMYAVDSRRQPMIATGVVSPVQEWEEGPDGRRRQSERQARDEQSGLPLWDVEVMYRTVVFGKDRSATAMVQTPATEKPMIREYTLVTFGDLVVTIRVTKAAQLIEKWQAAGLADFSPTTSAPKSGASAPSAKGTP